MFSSSAAALRRCHTAVARTNRLSCRSLTARLRMQTGRRQLRLPTSLPPHDTFVERHIGPSPADVETMLKVVGEASLDTLIDNTVPASIRIKGVDLPAGRGESEMLAEFASMMDNNLLYRSHIGAGYYGTLTPGVIKRNILENPGWYTPYTPYSAEVSQGRLEMLLNFQTMISDLTGLPVANASLLDEATAAAEAMNLAHGVGRKKNVFLVSDEVHIQTQAVLNTRAAGLGIEVIVQNAAEFDYSGGNVCGILVQYPGADGQITDIQSTITQAQENKAVVTVASDLLSLAMLKPPGDMGADIVVGTAQRFGVPMGFGGPHAAFFAVREEFKRKVPGRIIGVSKDSRGQPALRMAMQTREQHIKRDKATSNICTAQALLANISAAFAIYHGATGIRNIATRTHAAACAFGEGMAQLGFSIGFPNFFDTVAVECPNGDANMYHEALLKHEINVRVANSHRITVAFDETTVESHIQDLLDVFARASQCGKSACTTTLLSNGVTSTIPNQLVRTSNFLTHPVFTSHRSETDMMRYLFKLQSRDLGLNTSMIPLGSCTMKLNATAEMFPITWPSVNSLHPFVPTEQTVGYQQMLQRLHRDLCEITGFFDMSFQPNAGAQGEYTGLLCIDAYHRSRNEQHRNVCLIPMSAHGTNPASAVMAGMKVVVVDTTDTGTIDMVDLKTKVDKHRDNLSCIMLTYPSTCGVFEADVKETIELIHANGGQVYMDGANMNAQVGLTSPGFIGADVCHLNLHKTFCIPHGGGGPGMGPIGVAKHLAPFLPSHPLLHMGGDSSAGTVAAAPFSSASILPISFMYICLMGAEGLTQATKVAILNANYMAARLRDHYPIKFVGENGHVAHEFILDLRGLKKQTGITEEDVAKRLIDYNLHAPTMSWPIAGTLMVEPTESESKAELDRFCDAMISIREEIREVADGKADPINNVLKNAPHTADVLAGEWQFPYSKEQAAYPLPFLREHKFWPSVTRIDNVFGDRNVVCTCPPLTDYV